MTRADLKSLSSDDLVAQFASIGAEQREAGAAGDTSKYNILYSKMQELEDELMSRPGDQRRLLLPLLEHKNLQVRLKAAVATLAIAPTESRDTLRRIAESRRYPQAANAGFMLAALDDGRYVPK
jgi:hypothetical protein